MISVVLLSVMTSAPGLYWGFTLQGGLQAASDEDVEMGSGRTGGLRYDLGEVLNDSLGVGLAAGLTVGTTDEFRTSGGYLGLAARITPTERITLQPTLAFAFQGLNRRDAAAETDDDPGGLFGARTSLGASYDVAQFDNGFALAVGLDASATYGSGTVIWGGGATFSITRTQRKKPVNSSQP